MADKILIVRLSAIGDIVMSSCLAEGFKQAYPDSKISWLVQPGMDNLLAANPFVDEVIIWPRGQWQALWQQRRYLVLLRHIRQFFAELKQRRFTIAVDAQGLLKSGLFAWRSGAKRRIGLDSREGSAHLMTEVYHAPYSKQIGAEYRYLLQQLGVGSLVRMAVPTTEHDQQYAMELLQQNKIGRPFIVFCPFSTRIQKNWTAQHWIELARLIDLELDMDCVILGAPADKDEATAMARQQHNLHQFAGQTSLRQAAAMIEHASGVVGVDTGLTHIGVVSDKPTIALFGSTCPYLHTDSNVARVIYHDLDCAPCKRNPTCDGAYTCMHGISATEAMTELKSVLPQ